MEQNLNYIFDVGEIRFTLGAVAEMEKIRTNPWTALYKLVDRHGALEPGELDPEDQKENERAVFEGRRIFSAYKVDGIKFYVITEWDRSLTTVLLPEEY